MYGITTFSCYDNGTVADDTRRLSPGEFYKIEQERADAARPKVLQRRVSFLWERQAFELHTDLQPAYGISVLYRHSEVMYVSHLSPILQFYLFLFAFMFDFFDAL